jgi:hypothetical protein
MKRVALTGCVALASGLILAACLPVIPKPVQVNLSSATPLADELPSPGSTTTPTSTLSIESSSTSTLIPTSTFTPIPSFTSTIGSIETTTPVGVTPTIGFTGTAAPSALTAILVTDTATPFGALSNPNTIYGPVHIQNKSRLQVDLSLHCTTSKGVEIIIEFNRVRNVVTMLPEGDYVYVIYMGGRQSIGSFSYLTVRKLSFTIYQDGVVIQ